MPFSMWLWVIAAGLALAGCVVALRRTPPAAWEGGWRGGWRPALWLMILALFAVATGLGWWAWVARSWPGASPPDALALLAGGGLVVAFWMALGGGINGRVMLRAALAATLILVAVTLAAAAMLAQAWPAMPMELPARAWPLGVRNLLASIGLGGWIPALAASVSWYIQAATNGVSGQPTPPANVLEPEADASSFSGRVSTEAAGPSGRAMPVVVRPAEDHGRGAALFSFPWLTAACLAGGAYNLVAYGTVSRAAPADSWLLTAWLLGGAYLHVTSSWRPLRLPGWLAPLLAVATLAAGLLGAGAAGTLR